MMGRTCTRQQWPDVVVVPGVVLISSKRGCGWTRSKNRMIMIKLLSNIAKSYLFTCSTSRGGRGQEHGYGRVSMFEQELDLAITRYGFFVCPI